MNSSVSKNYDLIASIFDHDMALNMRYDDIGFYVDRINGKVSVLEVGCGTGRISIPVSRVCDHLVGIDISLPMLFELKRKLESAAEKTSNIQLIAMNACSIALQKKFDYIFFGFSSINYLTQPAQVANFLLSLKPLLTDGGCVLLDAFVPKVARDSTDAWMEDYIRVIPGGGKLKRLKSITAEGDISFVRRRYERYSVDGNLEQVINTESRIRPYSPEDLCRFLQEAGFELQGTWWNYEVRAREGADFFSVEARLE